MPTLDDRLASDDTALVRALTPTVELAIRQSVRRDPQPLADAIFPVIGPAIRKAIATAIGGLIESMNQAAELAFSLQAVRWRIEAWRTGRSFGEVVISHRGERFGSSPWGLEGGGPGARAHAYIVRADGTREELPSKKMIVLHPGDQLWEYIAGGGGYGDPLERDAASVFADVLDGKVSVERATDDYGVVVTPDGAAVDEVRTKARREALRRVRAR